MTKKEQVGSLYRQFVDYTKTAEQQELPLVTIYDALLSKGYEDLQKNWDEEHADVFIRVASKLLVILGTKELEKE